MRLYYKVFVRFFQKVAKTMCADCARFIQPGSKILDLGCGSGIIGQALSERFKAQVLGVDIKDNRIVNLPFQLIDGENLPFRENEFDICFISYVLHHARHPLSLLAEAKRVCQGKIIIYEDLPEGVWSRVRCYVHRMTYLLLFGAPKTSFNFKSQTEWEVLFANFGLKAMTKKTVSSKSAWPWPGKRILYILEKTC